MQGNCFLLGNIAQDAESLDQKARERKPTVLRAVVLGRQPSQAQAASILDRLKSILPTHAGPDAGLMMDVPGILARARPKPVENTQSFDRPGANERKKALLVMLAVLTASILAVSVTFQPKTNSGPPKPEDLKPLTQKMAADLAG